MMILWISNVVIGQQSYSPPEDPIDEVSDLIQTYTEDQTWAIMKNRYEGKVLYSQRGTLTQPPLGKWSRIAVTGFRAYGLHNVNLTNTEKNWFTRDGKYLVMKIGSSKWRVYKTKSWDIVRDISIPSGVNTGNYYLHHRLPILYYTIDQSLHSINVETGDESTQDIGFQLGQFYKDKWARHSGGDGNDISLSGHFITNRNDKYGSCSVLKFPDDSAFPVQVITKTPWDLPSGSDYAMASYDGSHVIIVGQKGGGLGIEAYDFEGNHLGQINASRAHTDNAPFYCEDGKWRHSFSVKYNQSMATKYGVSTGTNQIVVYSIVDGKVQEYKRINSINGKSEGREPINMGGEHGSPGDPRCLEYMRTNQINKDESDGVDHSYMGVAYTFGTVESDTDPRLIAFHDCTGGNFDQQPEGTISPDGRWALIKFGAKKGQEGRMSIVELPYRLPKSLRNDYLESGDIDHSLIASTSPWDGVITNEFSYLDPSDEPILPEDPISDPITPIDLGGTMDDLIELEIVALRKIYESLGDLIQIKLGQKALYNPN